MNYFLKFTFLNLNYFNFRHLKVHTKDKMNDAELDKLVLKVDELHETPIPDDKDDNTEDPDYVVEPQKPTTTSLDKKGRPKKHQCQECGKAFEKPSKLKR